MLDGDKVIHEKGKNGDLNYIYDAAGALYAFQYNGPNNPGWYLYKKDLQGDITGILDINGTEVVSYRYDTWGKLLSTTGSLANTIGEINEYLYRGYRYDRDLGLYYLQSRYYNPDIGKFINTDNAITAGTGILAHNLFTYSYNDPVNLIDTDGQAARSPIWSYKSDAVGRAILFNWLYGNGEPAIVTTWGAYMMADAILTAKVKNILFPIGNALSKGKSKNINITTHMEIENGEDIIGYQYLHGTNASVGDFNIKGVISKSISGDVCYNLTYTWNDMIDPNFQYSSDKTKYNLAKKIPGATLKNYRITIIWSDYSTIRSKNVLWPQKSSGWLS